MRIVLTGARGFMGWHTRLRAHALTQHEITPVGREEWPDLPTLVAEADAVIHIAGVNRARDEEGGLSPDEQVNLGNVRLAEELAEAVRGAGRPVRVVYANSIQAGNGTPYGAGKQRAGEVLREAVESTGGHLTEVMLPNLFGEHCRPNYNSFTATFIDKVIKGEEPTINDNPVNLLHAQKAAAALLEGLETTETVLEPKGEDVGVQEVWDLLVEFHESYVGRGEIPDLSTDFRIDLFNSYRTALFPEHYPIKLKPHADPRGFFVETVRCAGGQGQSSISTTVPGITRGEHYHLSKIERFAVVQGTARMSLRKMFTDEVLDFHVTGEETTAVDMPVGWVHNITNTGDDTLITQFWVHEFFDPENPDTFPEPVRPATDAEENAR
ncbi:UDP-2-acetamido-2,6-beta-L-arabino-hexul-4-ose reductase [Kytococcus aerolatus]|uniref:UDP-2-acetamido-2,6-beta-L-arabino-hexul-4-ose reductase n=1 Tax=Kytococcus aerolatus TaxID=592308 RepID=A0A212T6R4_9MICO|nr:NAD-dependent epimerase/dehydratase family protein [Kytococcus aerolatus]SNC61718.1 UDP-2-acetamido-2,6-beta-L-arabino-hexul-4-ose reductase [Kytococcus aerolatus]